MKPQPLPDTLYGLLESAIAGSKKLDRRSTNRTTAIGTPPTITVFAKSA